MIYRRCSCTSETGKRYGNLPADKPTAAQRANACPTLLSDPKHGKWGFYLSRGYDGNGKRIPQLRVANFTSKREAQSAYAKAKAQHDTKTLATPSARTVAEWIEEWLTSRERPSRGEPLKTTTLDNYRNTLRLHIAPFAFGRQRLSAVSRLDVRRHLDALTQEGRGTPTVQATKRLLSSAFSSAVDDGLIMLNPVMGLRVATARRKTFEPWSPAQVAAYLDHVATHRLGAIFETAVWTGLRRGELLALRWSDIDFTRRTITVRANRVQTRQGIVESTPKTRAGERVTHLDDALVGALIALQIAQHRERERAGDAWEGDGHVFAYEDGRALRPDYATYLFKRLRADVNERLADENVDRAKRDEEPHELLSEITLHGLRHMHASLLLAAGVPIEIVSKRLGHSSIAITSDTYSHLLETVDRDAAESAAALVAASRRTTVAQRAI